MATTLHWVYRTARDAEEYVIAGDAAAALVEMGEASFDALAESMSFTDLGAHLPLPKEPLVALDSTIAGGRAVFSSAERVVGLLPRPEDIAVVRREIRALLGTRLGGNEPTDGSLDRVMMRIGL